ncbi:MAG: hypothetical protein M3M85_02055 [bacterium]|nr:hypothetical protein [bacterium]
MKKNITVFLGIGLLIIIILVLIGKNKGEVGKIYNPIINPAEFTTKITNPYFNLPVGRKFIYEGETSGGKERIEIEILSETKEVMGVATLVYWDRVWLDGELIEDTRDYLAQDKEGNVWYFGEDVDNYEEGVLADHDGSWLAGVDGAKPGIWMKANPKVGEEYFQEYYKGVAEDKGKIISLTENVTIPYGAFSNCLKTYDFTALDKESKEYKYYCKEMGGLVQEEDIITGDKVELVGVK